MYILNYKESCNLAAWKR